MNLSTLAKLLGSLGLMLAIAAIAVPVIFYPDRIAARYESGDFLGPSTWVGLSFSMVGLLVAAARPRHRMGWILLGIGFTQAVDQAAGAYVGITFAPYRFLANWLNATIWVPGLGLLMTFVLLLYPDGKLPSPRWRPLAWVAGVGIAVATVLISIMFWPLRERYGNVGQNEVTGFPVFAGVALVLGACMVASMVSLALRYRRSSGAEREQIKWFLAAASFLVAGIVISDFLSYQVPMRVILEPLIILALPAAIGMAILRYRLYDIDVVINKSLVYGALAAFITAVYVGIVVVIGAFLGGGGKPNLLLSILATTVVAVAFQPVRQKVQRVANRLVYGARATPYEVMAGFSHRLAGALGIDEILPRMAEAAARAVGADRSQVRLLLPEGGDRVVTWPAGAPPPFNHAFPVSHRNQTLGDIAVNLADGQRPSSSDEKLLRDLAAQAGIAFSNVRLTAELQARLEEISTQAEQLRASRQRIVAAADEQKRRLQAELREGTERHLEAVSRELDRASALMIDDPAASAIMLDSLTTEANRLLTELRELARGVFPPLLVDRGLVPALEALVNKDGDAELGLGGAELRSTRFSPEVEAAVYFCCVTALRAGVRTISLAADGAEIRLDLDGVMGFFNPELTDRIEAVGGALESIGNRLTARIPIVQAALPAAGTALA